MVKNKKVLVSIICAVVLLAMGSVLVVRVINRNKQDDSPIELKCIEIPEGQVQEIIIIEQLYGKRTAGQNANFMENDNRYSGGYVNEKGQLVAIVNQEQAHYWFDMYYTSLVNTINASKDNKIRAEVSSRCDVLKYYVNSDTTLQELFDTAFFFTIPSCLMVQEYAGVPYEDIDVKMQVIYEPTGEIMYELKLGEDYRITEEDWEVRLNEVGE